MFRNLTNSSSNRSLFISSVPLNLSLLRPNVRFSISHIKRSSFSDDDLANILGYRGTFQVPFDNSLTIPENRCTIIQGYINTYFQYFERNNINPSFSPVKFKGTGQIKFGIAVSFCLGAYSSVARNVGLLRSGRVGRLFDVQLLAVFAAYNYIYAVGVTNQHIVSSTSDTTLSAIGYSHLHSCKYFTDQVRNALLGEQFISVPTGGSTARFSSHTYRYEGKYELADWLKSSDVTDHVNNIVSILVAFSDSSVEESKSIRRFIEILYENTNLTSSDVTGMSPTQLFNLNSSINKLRSNQVLSTKELFSSRVDRNNIIALRKAFIGGKFVYGLLRTEVDPITRFTDFGFLTLDLNKLFPTGIHKRSKAKNSWFNCAFNLNDASYVPGANECMVDYLSNFIELETPLSELPGFGISINQHVAEIDTMKTKNFSAHCAWILKYVFNISLSLSDIYYFPKEAKCPKTRKFKYTDPSLGSGLVIEGYDITSIMPMKPYFGFSPKPDGGDFNQGGGSGLPHTDTLRVTQKVPTNIGEEVKDNFETNPENGKGSETPRSTPTPTEKGNLPDGGSDKGLDSPKMSVASYVGELWNYRKPDNISKTKAVNKALSNNNLESNSNTSAVSKIVNENQIRKRSLRKAKLLEIRARYAKVGLTLEDYFHNQKFIPINSRSIQKKIAILQNVTLPEYNFSVVVGITGILAPYHVPNSIHTTNYPNETLEFIEFMIRIGIRIPPIYQVDTDMIKMFARLIGYSSDLDVQIKYPNLITDTNESRNDSRILQELNLEDISLEIQDGIEASQIRESKRNMFRHKLVYHANRIMSVASFTDRVFSCHPLKYKGKTNSIKVEIVTLKQLSRKLNFQKMQTENPIITIQYDFFIGLILYNYVQYYPLAEGGAIFSCNISIYLHVRDDSYLYEDDDDEEES